MSGMQSEIRRKKQAQSEKTKAREGMKREAGQATGDSRLEHYVGQEKAALKKGAKAAEAIRKLRQG